MLYKNIKKKVFTKIIIALDYSNEKKALNLIKILDPQIYKIKIGKEMFFLLGIDFVKKIINLGFKVFLDLKLHDIPNTVFKAIISLSKLNLWMISVHALGGKKMMEFAKSAVSYFQKKPPLLVAITVLSSLSEFDMQELGIFNTINKQVLLLLKLSQKVGLDGIVCPGNSVKYIKNSLKKNYKIITPGIRLEESSLNDQKNVITPEQAITYKINYIVLGRIITCSKNPLQVLKKINSLIMK
ncbi:Orotidine 5'-phosphate decarboxylase [Buchnera aphidicola (Sipha maydis)]|uniref:orotidine-5'-phosphate decarboxylase n=1 Tax=Buchnera aphidicola TaxID=9 RepID=UPI002543961B|nr:orotidine-5'-phosphate decarboxylase [Buchnera aphidicola]WII23860.1 orotidine-5'-phosphate decarboxylase [Buchnera aphidicola (Sipha maydis)]